MILRKSFHRSLFGDTGSRRGPDRDRPAGLSLIAMIVLAAVVLLSPRSPWSPPFFGAASLNDLRSPESDWEMVVDPTGAQELLADERYFGYLFDTSVFPRGTVRLTSQGERAEPQLEASTLFFGGPRAALRFGRAPLTAKAELYQAGSGLAVLSGPIVADCSALLVAPENSPPDLTSLTLLPREVERLALLDYRSVRLPKALLDKLLGQFKKWEFYPNQRLSQALAPPFGYAEWDGGSILSIGVKDPDLVKKEIQERYPDSVVPKTVNWAETARIEGLGSDDKPAWFFRGDSLIVTPLGGTRRLERLLRERHERGMVSVSRDFDQEFSRLAESEEGWHFCLLDRSPDKPVWWALLLRLEKGQPGVARGYLIVEPRPKWTWDEGERVSSFMLRPQDRIRKSEGARSFR